MYHTVRSNGAERADADCVSAEMFADQMRWLREESRLAVLSLSQGVEKLADETFDTTTVAVTFDDGYLDTLRVAAPILQRYEIPFTVFVVGGFVTNPPARDEYLDARALRELAACPGAAIGAHGHSHRPLTRLDDGAIAEELRRSATTLEDALGATPVGLSYPHGAVDARVIRHAREAGFEVGATSMAGVNRRGIPTLLLRRTEIAGADGLADFKCKIRGAFDWYQLKQRMYWPVPHI